MYVCLRESQGFGGFDPTRRVFVVDAENVSPRSKEIFQKLSLGRDLRTENVLSHTWLRKPESLQKMENEV